MAFPFQCLIAQSSSSEGANAWTLFGASGSKLVVQSSNGTTSVWPQHHGQVIDHAEGEDEAEGPPGKRIKLSPPKESKAKFSTLILSNDGQYLVGVTGEDKCIRVFQLDSRGQLEQLSERCMTRRPSSIVMNSDDSMILCADKFGDVYALPLLPSPDDEQLEPVKPVEIEAETKEFTPSASVLTVHSGRNRKTLEEQLKQKAKAPLKTKEVMTFRHDLLLGHVSMLTDIAHAKIGNRSYIVTADRDEHIRVSRGLPQAHIIEGFCFGHEEFVSKLCVTRSGLLVSGGGDPQLFVWDWQNYRLVTQLPLRDTALQHLKSRTELVSSLGDDASFKVAVSGIWEVPSSENEANEILVACEGLPVLFSFTVGSDAVVGNPISLDGNALAVALVQTSRNTCTAVVSVDHIRKPGSTTEVRDGLVSTPTGIVAMPGPADQLSQGASRLQYFAKQADGQWHEDAGMKEVLKRFVDRDSTTNVTSGDATREGPTGLSDDKAMRDMLYNVENLRKRPGAEDGGGA